MSAVRWAVLAAMCAGAVHAGGGSSDAGRRGDRTALWRRDGRDVLSGFRNLYNLRVVRVEGSRYPYRGWLFGWAVEDCNRNAPGNRGCDAIFAARSRALDGPWEVWSGGDGWDATGNASRWRPVMTAQDRPWDEWHNGDPSVVRVGGRFYMAYSATGHNLDGKPYGVEGDRDGSILCIMGAVSADGVHWKRSPEPILIHRPDLGAPHVPHGESHAFGSYHRPSLLHERGVFRLWFDYWHPGDGGVSMGYAECRGDFLNPAHWRVLRAGRNPCLKQFPNPNVVRCGRLLHAFGDPPTGDPHPWITRRITEAVSADGLRWTVLGFVRADADAPAIHVPEAFVEPLAGGHRLHVFYACQNGGEPYDYRYSRIRRMYRDVLPSETARLARELARTSISERRRKGP